MKIGILGCGSAEAQALIAALMKVEMGDEGQKDRPAVGRILLVEAGGDYGLDFESMKSAIKPAMHESPYGYFPKVGKGERKRNRKHRWG